MSAPHFRFPFRLSGSAVAVVEQDTYDEVAQSVQMILTTPKGSRIEVPDFGIDDPVFSVDTSERATRMLEAVNAWEPRARARIEVTVDNVDEFVHRIRAEIADRPDDLSSSVIPAPAAEQPVAGYGVGGWGVQPWGQ